MKDKNAEISRRTAAARAAIQRVMDDGEGEMTVALFVSHHLGELDASHWQKHVGTPRPSPKQVLDLLELSNHWGGDADIDTLDFTLPGNVTDYVIAVGFNENGDIRDIDMES